MTTLPKKEKKNVYDFILENNKNLLLKRFIYIFNSLIL